MRVRQTDVAYVRLVERVRQRVLDPFGQWGVVVYAVVAKGLVFAAVEPQSE